MYQYERDYIICTKTKHKTPMIRTQSIVSVSEAAKKAASMAAASKEHRHRHRVVNQQPSSSKVEKVIERVAKSQPTLFRNLHFRPIGLFADLAVSTFFTSSYMTSS